MQYTHSTWWSNNVTVVSFVERMWGVYCNSVPDSSRVDLVDINLGMHLQRRDNCCSYRHAWDQQRWHGVCVKLRILPEKWWFILKNDDLYWKMMRFELKNDEIWIEKWWFILKNDGIFKLKNDDGCMKRYVETNWNLPLWEQINLARQNIYDGTWTKIPSQGWMFVPLVQVSLLFWPILIYQSRRM